MRSDSESSAASRATRAVMCGFGWAAVAMLSIAVAPSPGAAAPAPAPAPAPLSPADHQRVRIMNVATQKFLLVAGSAGGGDRPHTAYTGGGHEGQQFNLELIKLLDMEEEEESVFAVKGSGGRVLKVTEDGAEAVPEPAAWDKSSDAALLFHRRQTTCKDTVALESVSVPGRFLCDAEGGALTLRPVQREEAARSKCLLEGASGSQLQERILFRLTALRP